MSLIRFELRKLLLNKKTLLLLLCLFVLYSVVGLTSTMFLIGSNDSYRSYEELAAYWEGPFDSEKAAEAEKIYQEISTRYGTDARMIARSVKDQPEIILAVNYHAYAERVEEYWNGTPPESAEEPYGISLLQGRIAELESHGKQDSSDYRELSAALKRLEELGEPEFVGALLWENLFNNWGEHMMQFLLFVPLTFVIAPVFAVERSSGMDNLILSARNGRRKIVTAKLLSVLAASTVVAALYLAATFLFGFLPHGSFHGWDVAIQSIPTYARSMFPWKVWQLAAVGAAWLVFTGAVYSLIICLISSRMKSQMGTAGVSLAILFVNVGLAAMGDAVTQRLGALVDFGLANVTLMKEVFGGYKGFNIFGMYVSYPIMAVFVLGVVSTLAVLWVYRGKRSRTVQSM
ncbi:ABC transporter permease [uncultured Oscillibacter sp.]|uniref:ABC transporter permease n=1 Tax=uncultured Oscillibacter sp. TaxID=876091 RepID=UPI0026380819|nr:ABC transporter permease subunit [uncultured Oscillibacter sp.]